MSNNSSTGGYLVPASSPAPLEDDAFDDFLHDIGVGITGMDPTLVRPRWQPESINLPDFGTNWMALGVTETDPDTYGVEVFDPVTLVTHLQRHEVTTILCSFYGPNANGLCSQFRDGLQISQNREALWLAGMALVETGKPMQAPELIKDRWTRRVDMPWVVRRGIFRDYPVLSLLSASGTLYTDVPNRSIPINAHQ